jgi:hypothetical protein
MIMLSILYHSYESLMNILLIILKQTQRSQIQENAFNPLSLVWEAHEYSPGHSETNSRITGKKSMLSILYKHESLMNILLIILKRTQRSQIQEHAFNPLSFLWESNEYSPDHSETNSKIADTRACFQSFITCMRVSWIFSWSFWNEPKDHRYKSMISILYQTHESLMNILLVILKWTQGTQIQEHAFNQLSFSLISCWSRRRANRILLFFYFLFSNPHCCGAGASRSCIILPEPEMEP